MVQSNDSSDEKRALRGEVGRRIRSMEAATRSAEEGAIMARLLELPGLSEAETVLLFWGHLEGEPSTDEVARRCLGRGQRLLLPRVNGRERRLELRRIESLEHDLVPGPLGILEPRRGLPSRREEEVDWVLVPGLAFDRRGARLGRGAGYYDRLLPRLRAEVPRWAVALGVQRVERLAVEAHDQPVDGVLGADWCWICSPRAGLVPSGWEVE